MDLIDAIKSEVRITEYAQAKGYTVLRVGNAYTLKEHDSVRIDADKNLFVRNSDRSVAGSIIDFVMWVDDVDKGTAIRKLRSQFEYGAERTPRARMPRHPPQKEKRPFEMPPPTQGRYNRVYAYLNKTRGIDNPVITAMMQRKLLYEDERHNCVFVGMDYDGSPAFATKRSTLTATAYRGDAAGSRKEVGIFVDNKAPALFVVEAPIDAMSIMSLLRANNRDDTQYSYLALCGVTDLPLVYHMSRPENEGIRRIYLATDNDSAGDVAREQLRKKLTEIGFKGDVIDKRPKSKDWNEDLLDIRQPGRIRQQPEQTKPVGTQVQLQLERGFER